MVLVMALAAACRGGTPPAPAQVVAPSATAERPDQNVGATVVPQVHDVPAGRANDVRRLFDSGAMSYPIAVVAASGTQTQFVQPRPVFFGENKFVVGAPKHVHDAIDALLKQLPPAQVGTSGTFELTYWLVAADPAAQTSVGKDIEELTPMLEGLKGLGPRKFRFLDRVGGQSRDGIRADINGRISEIDHKLTTSTANELELELTYKVTGLYSDRNSVINTTLQLQPDKPVVLGDTALAPPVDGAPAGVILYVVRAHRVD
jgi:hypothetical protein